MNTTAARRVEPTKSLLKNGPYVPAHRTATDGVLARWLWERSSENPANYPQDVPEWVREEA